MGMDIKDRMISMERTDTAEVDSIIVDEFSIEDEEVFHRNIVISQRSYDAFETNPDAEQLFDEFLQQNNIDAAWKLWSIPKHAKSENRLQADFSRLLNEIDSNHHTRDMEANQQTESDVYQRIYHELAKQETLIHNPLIIDVFNEAMRGETELSNWESVFPFFI